MGASTKSKGERHMVAPPSTRSNGATSVRFTPKTVSEFEVGIVADERVGDDFLETWRGDHVVHVGRAVGVAAKMAEHLAHRTVVGDRVGDQVTPSPSRMRSTALMLVRAGRTIRTRRER